MNIFSEKILVIAAHPDDEVLGCGGTMARLAREGCDVSVAILGEGITSRFANRDQADPEALGRLKNTCRSAANCLGVKDLHLYSLPDNRFDTLALLDVVKTVEEIIEKTSPKTIFTHHGGDLNIDHQIVSKAVLTATRPVKGQGVRNVVQFEVPSSTEWSFQKQEPIFRPNFFMNISATLELKIKAMALYDGETRTFPHPRSPEALKVIATRWGTVVGCEAAEAFEIVRCLC